MTQDERTRIIADEVRRGSSYAHAVALADLWAERQEKDAAERAARLAAILGFTDEAAAAKVAESVAALAARYPGPKAFATFAGAYIYVRDELASVNLEWRTYEGDWCASIDTGGNDCGRWDSDGHTTAAEALDAARAMLAESVRQMRADADQLEALLGGAEVPHG